MKNISIAQTSTRDMKGFPNHKFDFPFVDPIANLVKWMQNEPPKLQRLNLTECIDAYATNRNRKYGDALIVVTGSKIEYDPSTLEYDPQAFVLYFVDNMDDGRAFLLSSPERFLFNNTGRGKVEEANNNVGSSAIGSFDWMCNPPRVSAEQILLTRKLLLAVESGVAVKRMR